MSKDWEPETIFEVLGSEEVRRILAVANVDPVSVPDLAEGLDASEPTVYRRVNVCQEYDLLREADRVDDDGNHYKVYETTLERVCFELAGGGFEVDLQLRRETVDQIEDIDHDEASPEEPE
ncbi:winged helix-turn-helix domain-containing protein [Haloarcula sp. JP-L23]|uniref:winged helix-turn-helix domain-containing protein n=1 Tax=Haloarcula sp. JP-L23 TaxID=2716717 RepID=UPI00140F2CD9|nr:winged helix-turn-helix transcriptional regulator [Haloarcula sp. JP-L23]